MKHLIGVTSLGCDKNRVDTEKMLGILVRANFVVTSEHEKADIIIVNTCAFIESARVEAVEAILDAAEHKKTGNCKKLIVTGCLPQKHADELKKELPEVDAFLGVKDYESILSVVEGLLADSKSATKTSAPILINKTDKDITASAKGRFITTAPHLAYLRISDGCDNHCTYCTIPSIRGKYNSVPIEALVDETKYLIDSGAREIIIVAQDTTSYGKDIYGGDIKLLPLLEKLTTLNAEKFRLMYAYPHLVSGDLVKFIGGCDKMASYIDCPIQHADTAVLKRMNRPYTESDLYKLIETIRAQKNYIALRTTLIVGFPGESETEFATLQKFIRQAKPDHIGAFMYSCEEGTPAAILKEQIAQEVKRQRYFIVGELHRKNTIAYNKNQIGKTLQVRYEDIDFNKDMFVGRTEYNAPNIDTQVYFKAQSVDVGNMYNVRITGVEGYDLIGEEI